MSAKLLLVNLGFLFWGLVLATPVAGAPAPVPWEQAGPAAPDQPGAAGDGIAFRQSLGAPMGYTSWQSGILALARGDFNRDGKLDLAATESRNVAGAGLHGAVAILLGNGDGTFQPPTRVELGRSVFGRGLLARDFDRDGLVDLLVDVRETRQVLFFKGRGDGVFGAPVGSALPEGAFHLQAGDLNGDGVLDLALPAAGNQVAILQGTGTGRFLPATLHGVAGGPRDLAMADLDQDGDLDLVVAAATGGRVSVLLNQAGGFPSSGTDYQVPGVYPHGVQVGDYNGNGHQDVLVFGASKLVLVEGLGNGGLAAPPPPANFYAVEAGWRGYGENVPPDLDGDGKLDALLGFAYEGTLLGENAVTVAFGTGSGAFEVRKFVLQPAAGAAWYNLDLVHPASALAGDFDGDGRLDLAVGSTAANLGVAGGVSLLRATGPRTYAAPRIYPTPANRTSGPHSTVLADFTGDGKVDLAALDEFLLQDAGEVSLLPGSGDGTFGAGFAATTLTPGTSQYLHTLRTADFDQDGKLDLLWLDGGSDRTAVSFGVGNGAFTATVTMTATKSVHASAEPVNAVAADFDGDGYPDVAALLGYGAPAELELYTYNPAAPRTFLRQPLRVPLSPRDESDGMAAADFDEDGKLDLVVWAGKDGAGDRMLYLRGNGDGTFQPAAVIAAQVAQVHDVRAVDANGDGNLDLVAVAHSTAAVASTGALWVQLGNGNGTFQPPALLDIGKGPWALAPADFDGDGRLDVAVAFAPGFYTSGLALLAGNGDGTFGALRRFAAGSGDQDTLDAGDLDGDGKPELVVGFPGDAGNFGFAVLMNDAGKKADLAVAMGQAPVPLVEGELVTYTVVISNAGPGVATETLLTNPLRPGYLFVDAQPGQGACTPDLAASLLRCNLGNLAPGSATTVRIHALPRNLVALWNTASARSTAGDPNPTDNGAAAGQTEVKAIVVKSPYYVLVGATYDYLVRYANLAGDTLSNTVVLLDLPGSVEFRAATHGGIYDPARHQVFWRRGDLPPDGGGTLAAKVQVAWGVPNHTPYQLVAMMAGSNSTDPPFDVTPYLAGNPVVLSAVTRLSSGEVDALLAADGAVRELFDYALANGYAYHGTAYRLSNSDGSSLVQLGMIDLRGGEAALVYLTVTPDRSYLERVSKRFWDVFDKTGGWRYEASTGRMATWSGTPLPVSQAASQATWSDCMRNCIIRAIPELVIKQKFKVIDKLSKLATAYNCIASGDANSNACSELGEEALSELGNRLGTEPAGDVGVKLGKCKADCDEDPNKHVCTEDVKRCEKPSWFEREFMGWPATCLIRRCDKTTGQFLYFYDRLSCATIAPCGLGQVSVCKNGQCACIDPPTDPHTFVRPGDTVTAHDPNRKLGPGDVVAGQRVTYAVEYENTGAGTAFGVYIVDDLDPGLDVATLAIEQGGVYLPALRRIVWQVGDVPAGGKGQVRFAVNVRGSLPLDTVIANAATIVFPSVPEFTETNPVVSVVRAVAAQPQDVTTPEGVPLALTLAGTAPGGGALSFQIVAAPQGGTLSGAPPQVTYMPDPGFEGLDSFQFVASNGSATSVPAQVTVRVSPAASDTTPPRVVAVNPAAGASLVAETTAFADGSYYPVIWAQFDEPLDPATATSAAMSLLRNGQPVGGTVRYDAIRNELQFVPAAPLLDDASFDVQVTTALRDSSGNPLPAPYGWRFGTGAAGQSGSNVFLPVVRR